MRKSIEITCKEISSMFGTVDGGLVVYLEGLDMHDIFEGLTAAQIIKLIPDQTTLSEVRELINLEEVA